jgi:hypothetical protein
LSGIAPRANNTSAPRRSSSRRTAAGTLDRIASRTRSCSKASRSSLSTTMPASMSSWTTGERSATLRSLNVARSADKFDHQERIAARALDRPKQGLIGCRREQIRDHLRGGFVAQRVENDPRRAVHTSSANAVSICRDVWSGRVLSNHTMGRPARRFGKQRNAAAVPLSAQCRSSRHNSSGSSTAARSSSVSMSCSSQNRCSRRRVLIA